MRVSRIVVVEMSSHQIVAFIEGNRPALELANKSERASSKQRNLSDIKRSAEVLFVVTD
jgi:hypothetical protein